MPQLEIAGRTFSTSSLDRVVFPDCGVTKGDLVDYYGRIAEVMLPHIQDRPLTLHRFPAGISGAGFFQKQASDYFPEWLERASMDKEDGIVDYSIASEPAALVYLANQNTIAFHIWLSRQQSPCNPDKLVFDLDPPDVSADAVRFGARKMRELLEDELGLSTYLMSTGSKGLHVVVPLDGSTHYDTVREFAESAAETLCGRHSDRLTTQHRIEKRTGRLFLDYLRNAYSQTSVAPYSVRAIPGAPVAVPLDWDELNSFVPRQFDVRNIFGRLDAQGDPWESMWKRPCSLDEAAKRLEELAG